MEWSDQQKDALKAVNYWYNRDKKNKQVFSIHGYAGTGKTTLAKHFAESIGDVLFGAFTGKAALVMRKKGCIGARTIHSMIYIAKQDPKTGLVEFKLNRESPVKDAKLVIIDECSMVDEKMAKDLLSFGTPVLVLGDPAQLPPVSGAGYFTNIEPDVMITEIHRQAKDNPIIYMADKVRNGYNLDIGSYGDSRVITKMKKDDFMSADQIIVGRNVTRHDFNNRMRKMLGYDSVFPVVDEKLICLQNDKELGILNGQMFINKMNLNKKSLPSNFLFMQLETIDDDEAYPVLVKVHKSLFSDEFKKPDWKFLKGSHEFDYAYAISCHKSQGSQWDNILIFDESYCFRDDAFKWLYTAITRASEKVTIITS
jgi:exodeoxyribonuclease-5